jgi:hypothetical protein
MDLPDLSALVSPPSVLVINGSRDRLFALDGVKAAFDKIERYYAQGGRARSAAVQAVRRTPRIRP